MKGLHIIEIVITIIIITIVIVIITIIIVIIIITIIIIIVIIIIIIVIVDCRSAISIPRRAETQYRHQSHQNPAAHCQSRKFNFFCSFLSNLVLRFLTSLSVLNLLIPKIVVQPLIHNYSFFIIILSITSSEPTLLQICKILTKFDKTEQN